jgi:hypothetical protein
MDLHWRTDHSQETLQITDVEVRTDSLLNQLTDFDLERFAEVKVVEEKKVEEEPKEKRKKGKKEVVEEVIVKPIEDEEPEFT